VHLNTTELINFARKFLWSDNC